MNTNKLVASQALDEGLWFVARTAPEAYLQAALRELHATIEAAQVEPVAWHEHVEQRLLTWQQSFVNRSGDQLALDDFMDKQSLDDLIDFVCDEWALSTHPSPPEGMAGWISVDERLPEVGVTVLVYEPFRHGEDWPDTVRIFFDYICPDYEGWHNHCESYEHFMIVGGSNACGPDVTCTGPSEKAPYTHWMPLPAPPLASEAKGAT